MDRRVRAGKKNAYLLPFFLKKEIGKQRRMFFYRLNRFFSRGKGALRKEGRRSPKKLLRGEGERRADGGESPITKKRKRFQPGKGKTCRKLGGKRLIKGQHGKVKTVRTGTRIRGG